MNPPPGATMTAVPLGCSGLNTMIVGSVTSVTRPGCAPPKDWINFVVASDFGFIALGTPSGQSFKVSGSGTAAVGRTTNRPTRQANPQSTGKRMPEN